MAVAGCAILFCVEKYQVALINGILRRRDAEAVIPERGMGSLEQAVAQLEFLIRRESTSGAVQTRAVLRDAQTLLLAELEISKKSSMPPGCEKLSMRSKLRIVGKE